MNNLIVYPSFRCNYNCDHCLLVSQSQYHKIYPKNVEHSVDEWLVVLNDLPPSTISFSCGEPTLIPGFFTLMSNLDKKHVINFTSNVSKVTDEFSKCRPDTRIVASYHPQMTSLDDFVNNVLILKNMGFSLTVECVALPGLLDALPELRGFFETKLEIQFSIDPLISPRFRYPQQQKEILSKLLRNQRRIGFDFNGMGKKKTCMAGGNYCVIAPNGDCYACHEGFFYETSSLHKDYNQSSNSFNIGNLFDGTLHFSTKERECYLPCSEACDLTFANVRE